MSQGSYEYLNCYAILEEVRTELNEYGTELCQGTEAGVYDNSDIVRKINMSQRYLFNLLFTRFPDLFLTSSSITGSSGVYTLPTDFYRMSHVINSNGDKLYPMSVKSKHLGNTTGSSRLYWRQGNTLVVDDGTSSALTLYYFKTVKEMTQGMSSAGGALSITLATTAKAVADYYNGITIENITDGNSSVISDYTAARVATITTTGAASKYYGTVSELPEVFHHLISRRATHILKNEVVSPQRTDKTDLMDWKEDLIETLRSFTGSNYGDVSLDEVFYDFQSYV